MTPAERNQEIVRRYHAGELLKDIAKSVGLRPHSVGQILKRLGIERPAKPQRKRKAVDETIAVQLWDRGLSVSAIAERFAVSQRFVADILKASGRKLDGRQRYDGEGGSIKRGGALQRVASRT